MKEKKITLSLIILISISILGCDKKALFSTNPRNFVKQSTSPTPTMTKLIHQTKNPSQSLDPSTPILKTEKIPRLSTHQKPQVVQKKSQHTFQDFFPYQLNHRLFHQPAYGMYGRNKTIISFIAQDNKGFHVRDLQKEDLIITENQSEVLNYTLSSEKQRSHYKLEIVFAIDIGGSMRRYSGVIEDNIKYFMSELKKYQIHTNFCLVTFKDSVETRCDRFNDNFEVENISRLFHNKISRREQKQNSLAGLLAAAKTGWGIGNQHIIILITDAQPWIHLEYKSLNLPFQVPRYESVLNALQGIQVFTLTHNAPWLSKDWSGFPSVVQATSGQWFDLKKLEKKVTNISPIFNQVRDQWNILHKIEYFVEDQQGLSPSLSLEKRQILLTSNRSELNFPSKDMQIEIQDVHSSMPEGNTKLQSRWVINKDEYIHPDNISVTVNDIPEYNFLIRDGEILFIEPPPEGSQIHVQYELGNLIDNIQRHSLVLKSHSTSSPIYVKTLNSPLYLNGKEASHAYFEVEFSDNGNLYLHLKESVFANEDPFDIRQSNGLDILFSYEILSQ